MILHSQSYIHNDNNIIFNRLVLRYKGTRFREAYPMVQYAFHVCGCIHSCYVWICCVCVCMYVSVRVCVCVHICTRMFIWLHILRISLFIYKHVYTRHTTYQYPSFFSRNRGSGWYHREQGISTLRRTYVNITSHMTEVKFYENPWRKQGNIWK